MSCPAILVPAYGRTYITQKELVDAYLSGVDFRMLNGAYCSCRDFIGKEVHLYHGDGIYYHVTKEE